jgi:membrane-associated protease RseP (regulator of RpoE activity)
MSVEHDLRRFPSTPPGARPEHFDAPPDSSGRASVSDAPVRFDWRKNLVLFLLTVASVFYVGRMWSVEPGAESTWVGGWQFAVPLLAILLFHEFGHYFAARLHRVPASLPYFLPLPLLSPFGTMGAIILMPRRIRSRKALLDIGAAGPLAGMLIAIPIMLYGLSLSSVGPRGDAVVQEGQSLLYAALKYAVFGAMPPDHDVYLHPTALAAWAGFLVTFLNLLPFGQLDGGHVAYALFGERQSKLARFVYWTPLLLIAYNFVVYALPVLREVQARGFASIEGDAWLPVTSSLSVWVVLFVLLNVLKRMTGFEHPPVDDHHLSGGRKAVAVLTLALFALLFMPAPWVVL